MTHKTLSLGPHLMLLPSPTPAPFSPHPSLLYGPTQQTCFCLGCGPFCGYSFSPRFQYGFLLSFMSLILLPQHFSNLLCLISFISNYYSNNTKYFTDLFIICSAHGKHSVNICKWMNAKNFPVLKIFKNCIIYFDSNFKVVFTNDLNNHLYIVYPPNNGYFEEVKT